MCPLFSVYKSLLTRVASAKKLALGLLLFLGLSGTALAIDWQTLAKGSWWNNGTTYLTVTDTGAIVFPTKTYSIPLNCTKPNFAWSEEHGFTMTPGNPSYTANGFTAGGSYDLSGSLAKEHASVAVTGTVITPNEISLFISASGTWNIDGSLGQMNCSGSMRESITVTPPSVQAISFNGAAPLLAVGETATVSVTGSSVKFSSKTPDVCAVNSGTAIEVINENLIVFAGTVTGLAVGNCTIAADQGARPGYAAAAQVTQSMKVFTVNHNIPVKPMAAGATHVCLLTAAGGVKCWGDNYAGQLGDGSNLSRNSLVDVTGLNSGVAALAAGESHTCALTSAGAVKCWGGYGGPNTPSEVPGLGKYGLAIAAGNSHTCALTMAGGVRCWGDNISGQLGNGGAASIKYQLEPTDVVGLTAGVTAITAGSYHSCALNTAGGVKCWGDPFGSTPVDIAGLANGATAIAAGQSHTCALTTAGGVKCWGTTLMTAYGDTPVDIAGLGSVTAIAAGQTHTCALTTTGGVKCWGYNSHGQLGDNFPSDLSSPTDVAGLTSGVTAIAAGGWHTCALSTTGAIKCLGISGLVDGIVTFPLTVGTSGGGGGSITSVPEGISCRSSCGKVFNNATSVTLTAIPDADSVFTGWSGACTGTGACEFSIGGAWRVSAAFTAAPTGITAIAAGKDHTCALTTVGGVRCWGRNYYGLLGAGRDDNLIPGNVAGLSSGVVAIAASETHTCALTHVGGVTCWGIGFESAKPVEIPGLASGVSAIAVAYMLSCALTNTGAVKCLSPYDKAPAEVAGLGSDVVAIAGGGWQVCALTKLGSVKCLDYSVTPIDILGLSADSAALAVGKDRSCALSRAGAIKCWTVGSNGSLRDVLGLGSDVKSIAIGNGTAYALTRAGGVKWFDSYGSGAGDLVGFTSGVAAISAGDGHTCVLPTSGNAKCWGNNPFGQLGNGTTSYDQSEPTDVTGLTKGVSSLVLQLSGLNVPLTAGWNLVGNGVEAPLAVAAVFNDAAKVATVWKWVPSGSTSGIDYPTWAFYTPTQADGGKAYAADRGYDFLTTVNGGEGFWVNAKSGFTFTLPTGVAVQSSSFMPGSGGHALPSGWSLIAIGDNQTVAEFNAKLSATPPTTTVPPDFPPGYTPPTPNNLSTLWAWDAVRNGWYFWSPIMVTIGTLAEYRASYNYLDFVNPLSPTSGFWVKRP